MRTGLFLLAVLALSFWGPSAAQARTILCRWGDKAKLAPIPGCGVPRQVQVTVPEGAWKFYFAVNENPGLSGYNHRAKGTAGPLRPFKRKINLLGSELFLCPADFKKERVLAFQLVSRRKVLVDRPTCRLGPPTETPKKAGAGSGGGQAGSKTGNQDGASSSGEAGQDKGEQSNAREGISKPLVHKGEPKAWRKIDRTARALAITALIFSLLALVAVALGIRYFQKFARQGRDTDEKSVSRLGSESESPSVDTHEA